MPLSHNAARTILLALAEDPKSEDKRAALEVVMAEKTTAPVREFVVPLPGRACEVSFRVPSDGLSAADWDYMLRVLDAMRPGLIVRQESATVSAIEETTSE